jgi:hypothetical protein
MSQTDVDFRSRRYRVADPHAGTPLIGALAPHTPASCSASSAAERTRTRTPGGVAFATGSTRSTPSQFGFGRCSRISREVAIRALPAPDRREHDDRRPRVTTTRSPSTAPTSSAPCSRRAVPPRDRRPSRARSRPGWSTPRARSSAPRRASSEAVDHMDARWYDKTTSSLAARAGRGLSRFVRARRTWAMPLCSASCTSLVRAPFFDCRRRRAMHRHVAFGQPARRGY